MQLGCLAPTPQRAMVPRSAFARAPDVEAGARPAATPQAGPASPRKWGIFPTSRTAGGAAPPGSAAVPTRASLLGHVVSRTWDKDADLTERQPHEQKVHGTRLGLHLPCLPC